MLYLFFSFFQRFYAELSQTAWKMSQFRAWRVTATTAIFSNMEYKRSKHLESIADGVFDHIYRLTPQIESAQGCHWLSLSIEPRRWPLCMRAPHEEEGGKKLSNEAVEIFLFNHISALKFRGNRKADNKNESFKSKFLCSPFRRFMCKIHQTLHFIFNKKKKY